MMLVDLYLKDGTVLKNCNIYREEVERGEMPFITKEQIDKTLSKVPWGIKMFSFQNQCVHGKIHVNNVDRYETSDENALKLYSNVKVIKNISEHSFKIGEIVRLTGIIQEDGETIFTFENEYDLEQGLYFEEFEIL